MVLLTSKKLDQKFIAPDFLLPSVDGKLVSLGDFKDSKGLLVAFICNHCPYVKAIEDRLIALRRSFSSADLAMVGICSNDAGKYPDDRLEKLLERWRDKDYGFPYLIDAHQNVAKSFDAVCTPDLFLFDQERKLFYHGALDDSWQDAQKVKQKFLEYAIKALIAHKPAPDEQKPSIGCSIKWL